MASTNATGGVAANSNFRQVYELEIKNQLDTNFRVLANHPKAVAYIVGITCVESGSGLSWKNVSVKHQVLPSTQGFGKYFEQHQVTLAARKNPSVNQTNLTQGRQAQSLLGCMGAYLIRGLQNGPKGFPHVQKDYSAVAESVGCLVNPGESLSAIFTEDMAGLRRGLVAGMCVLEYNYKIYLRKFSGDKDKAFYQTIKSHLGSPNSADVITGINGDDYLARVINNSSGYSNAKSSGTADTTYVAVTENTPRSSPDSSGITSPGTAPGCIASTA